MSFFLKREILTHLICDIRLINVKIALTGGGTLGHVYPALAIAQELITNNKDIDIFYISTKKANEIEVINQYGIRNFPITSGKLRRYLSFENIKDFFKVIKGFFQALKILRKEKPEVLFSKGGYLSVPVVFAAHCLKIRILTHESDSTLGLATRLNAKVADKVLLGFNLPIVDNLKYFYTGNPIRAQIVEAESCETFKNLILVLGGSQGAKEINELVTAALGKLTKLGFVYHQTGALWDKKIECNNYYQTEFISKEFGSLLKSAKVVITRSGAGAISEAIYCKIPMILIPLGTKASRGDQILNAEFVDKNKMGFYLEDKTQLVDLVEKLVLDTSYYLKVKAEFEKIKIPPSTKLISDYILERK